MLHALAARGVRAVLVERDRIASGASGRNAGFLLSGAADNYAVAVRDHNRATARELWHFTAENHDLLLDLLGSAAGRVGHRRCGALTLATADGEAEELRQSAQLLAEDGLAGRWVDAPPEAPPGCGGGLLSECDGETDPVVTVAALAATAPPGSICEQVAVRQLEPGAASVRVDTTAGEVICGEVVLATNAWTAELLPDIPITPVRAQMLAALPPSPATPSARPAYAHRGHRYWRRLAGGVLIAGGCRELAGEAEWTGDTETTDAVQGHLDAFVRGLGVDTAGITHRWAGAMGFSPDGLPLVGRAPGRSHVWVCGGYTGHGMGMAVNATRHLARSIVDGVPSPAWLEPARFGGQLPLGLSSPSRS
jgi:glycine/D-amino acid oxidase-like deaminating enzyme